MNHLLTVGALYEALAARIPDDLSCPWDHDGLMVCPHRDTPVRRVLVALDATEEIVDRAAKEHVDVILTHHPLIFHGLSAINGNDTVSRKVIRLIQAGVSVMSFHTRLDTVDGGVNDTLAHLLDLRDVETFGNCDNPCGKPMGRIGRVASPMKLTDFTRHVKTVLHAPDVAIGDSGRLVSRVAVLGGGGSDDVEAARAAGADTYVTGELKYHQLCDTPYEGINLLAAGHFHTEFPVCAVLRNMVLDICDQAYLPAPEITVMAAHRMAWM